MYYPCNENKGVDQLCGYREADLRLCFHIYKKQGFSLRGSIIHVLAYYSYIEVYKTDVIHKIGVIFFSLLKYVYFAFFYLCFLSVLIDALKRYILHNFEIVFLAGWVSKG